MAGYQAIGAVAQGVARLLDQSWPPALLGGLEPRFEVYQGKDFSEPMATGISVLVYQVAIDNVQRTLPPAEPAHLRPLPITVALLLTAWGQDASTEHTLLGWAMRALADTPTLSPGFLNAATPGVFSSRETVEVVPAQLTNDEVFQLWQVLPGDLQLSMPYLARVVRLESQLRHPVGAPVRIREMDFQNPASAVFGEPAGVP